MAPSDSITLYLVKKAAHAKVASRFGLSDLFKEHRISPSAPGVLNHLKTFGRHVGEFGREAIFGSPLTLAEQLRDAHKTTGSMTGAVGKYYRDYFAHPESGTLSKLLAIGLPAASLAHTAVAGDPNTRGADVAQGLASVAAVPFTGRLGLQGLVLDQAIGHAARRVGGLLDPKPTPKPLLTSQALLQHMRNAAAASGQPLGAYWDQNFPLQ
jgi:hypothetical protein